MSESHSPTTDTQALLQSMLQRLKLQPAATGSQACQHQTSPTTTAAPSQGQNGGRGGDPCHETVREFNSIPVNGFGAAMTRSPPCDIVRGPAEEGRGGPPGMGGREMRKWDSREEFGIPVWDFGLKGKIGEINSLTLDIGKETSFSSSLGVISSPSHKNNTDGDRAESRDSRQAALPVLTPTGNMHRVSAHTPNNADVTSFERAEDEVQGGRDGNGNSLINPIISCDDQHSLPDTSPLTFQYPSQISRTVTEGATESRSLLGQDSKDTSPSLVQGFTPRVYAWSIKTAEASLSSGSESKSTTPNRGGSGPKPVPEPKPKKRSSETKSRRWTQKIKERWKERHGSLTKKGKEEGEGEEHGKNEKELSPENHASTAHNLTDMSNKEGEMASSVEAPPALSGDRTVEDHNRTPGDFEFGLGSFSLLDEILVGHEWARFLSPTPPGGLANQKLLEVSTSRPGRATLNCQDQRTGQSSSIDTRPGDINNQWNMREPESAAVLTSTPPVSRDVCMPVNMDLSEPNHVLPAQDNKTELVQSEPMDHGHSQSHTEWNRAGQSGIIDQKNTALVDFTFTKPADVPDNSSLKNRGHLNRKRVHRSQEKGGEEDRMEEGDVRERKEAKRDESMYLPGFSISRVAHETEKINDNGGDVMSMSSLSSPLPPSSRPPVAVPRSALRHSLSQDSQSSVSTETVTKKRRVEETRRVRFSEDVIAITPVTLDLDISLSDDDDSVLEDDSSVEGDQGMKQTEQVVTPAARHALPAWIKALKRMKTGKKTKQ